MSSFYVAYPLLYPMFMKMNKNFTLKLPFRNIIYSPDSIVHLDKIKILIANTHKVVYAIFLVHVKDLEKQVWSGFFGEFATVKDVEIFEYQQLLFSPKQGSNYDKNVRALKILRTELSITLHGTNIFVLIFYYLASLFKFIYLLIKSYPKKNKIIGVSSNASRCT